MENIFVIALENLARTTNEIGGHLYCGSEAIDVLKNQAPKTFHKSLEVGDVVHIPSFVEKPKAWVRGPIAHGGPDVTRPICIVKRCSDFCFAMELFLSQFLNEFKDCEGKYHANRVLDRQGQPINFDKSSRYEQWALLENKNFRLVKVDYFDTVKFKPEVDSPVVKSTPVYTWQEVS